MADIQRWSVSHTIPSDNEYGIPNDKGNWVTYVDHLSAVAAAEQRGARIAGLATWAHVEGENMPNDAASLAEAVGTLGFDLGRQRGFAAGVKAAREAVEAENKNPISRVTTDYDIGYRDGTNDTVRLHLRAIDALTTRDEGRNTG